MPKEFVSCVNALLREGKAKDSAYAICTDAYKKRHGGRSPQEDHVKTSVDMEDTEIIIQAVKKRKDVNPKEGKSEYGDVTFADETNKKYPLDSEKHVRAAWSYINMPKNASKYSSEDLKKIKGKIKSAARKLGIAISESFAITVDSLEGVQYVEQKELIPEKGVSVVLAEGKIRQYIFDLLNANANWTEESAAEFVKAALEKWNLSSVIQAEITFFIKQTDDYIDTDTLNRLKAVDSDPFFVPIHMKYGTGSNKQHFDRAFFEKAGPKFERTPFMFNHSDLNEFGNANPIGSIVKFAGTDDKGATFIAYVSASESKLRQKIRESQALQDKGFVKKVSIEGIPAKEDFTVDEKTGIKYFRDLTMPTGIAIVNREGLKGSQII